MKKFILLSVCTLVSLLSFAQTIQYKDKENDTEWLTLKYEDIKPGCLKDKEALKLSGDFSNFTVEWENSDDTIKAYETGPVIFVCCDIKYSYPDQILQHFTDPGYPLHTSLKYVDMSEVTDINSMQYIFASCNMLQTIVFPKSKITTAKNFEYAFRGCMALQNANLSMFNNIDNINEAFCNCWNMTEVKFCKEPTNKNVYIRNTFLGCTHLKGIDLSMYTINNDTKEKTPLTFEDCYSLDYVYLPQGYVSYVKSLWDTYKNSDPNSKYITQKEIFGENYNPNCLKVLSSKDDPKGVMDISGNEWTNVVLGDTAFTDIELTEGTIENTRDDSENKYYYYTYECPEEIQLDGKKAIFTPQMSGGPYTYQYANGVSGWNTIVLPFTGALQTKKGKEEYTSVYPAIENVPGYYWLREYKDGYGDAVTFDVVNNNVNQATEEALQANTPYIIAFPGKDFKDDSMIGKSLRFIATNGVLPKTTDLKVAGESGDYVFQGNLNGNQVSSTAYNLVCGNRDQDYFEQTTEKLNLPFHAQIIATGTSSKAKRLYIKSSNDATGIVGAESETPQEATTYFTIDGVDTGVKDARLLKKGIYIHGNKKVVVK